MDQDEISDPSDWKNTSLSGLYSLDSNLRCLICKDFYTAPVITTCLHTFCSICIRRSLTAEPTCPACRTTNISDSGLRQNKVVGDLVESFLAVRLRLLEIARNQPQVSKQDDDRIEEDELVILEPPPLVIKSGIHCPICQRPFKTVEQVDSHIDACTGPQATPSQQTYNLRPPKLVAAAPSSSNRIATTPLPKLNYAMYNETKLRAILAEQGLSTIGNKSILSARHKEFVNLHNANLDRRNPQSRHEILKQLENWDITQQSLPLKRKQELDGLEWGRKFEESYADLTKIARESVAKRRKVVGEDTKEDTSVKSSSQGERVA